MKPVQKQLKHLSYDLAQTAFFPLTGNPVGFHHLLLAECVLRQFAQLEQIVFILSNGKHPDPTKEQAIAPKQYRLEIFQKALEEFEDPLVSVVAKMADTGQESFQLNENHASIATVEFEQAQPVPLYAHVADLRQKALSPESRSPVQLIVGGDLLQRMSNRQIFTDADSQALAKNCEFLIAPREHIRIASSLQMLKQAREVTLDYHEIHLDFLPEKWHPFLKLSSTLIRHTIQAQHPLTCFLPEGAAKIIHEHNLYNPSSIIGTLNEWQQECGKLDQQLDQIARQLKAVLDHRADQHLPHTLALVETSTGGRLTAALGSLPGISNHFKASTIVYDQEAKNRLLGTARENSAVSREMALQLAEAFQQQIQADFVLSETGMAGPPEGVRHSNKQGQCYLALAIPGNTKHFFYQDNPFLSKKEHQLLFAAAALKWLLQNI